MKVSALFAKGLVALVLTMLALPSGAQVNDKAPKPIIEFTTTQIMSIIEEAPEYFDEDPDRFYGEIGSVLDATIDWRGFAKGVMGEYASNARYNSLDADGKKALRAQLESFTDIIKSGLIRTYAKGLLAFSGSKFEIVDGDDIDPNARSASITQLVYGSGDQTYTIRYQMGKRRDGSWPYRMLAASNPTSGTISPVHMLRNL